MTDNSLGDADYYDPKDYVGIGKRVIVIVIDSVILLILGITLWLPFVALNLFESIQTDLDGLFWIFYLFLIWVYQGPVKRTDFGTIGYRLLGIKIVSAKGGRPTLLIMTMRMLMWMFGPFNFVLDLLWLGPDSEHQTLRDCYLGTYLVNRTAKPIGRAPLHLTMYYSMGLALRYPRVCRPKDAANQ